MAFPFLFESNWESGTSVAEWDSEVDTQSKLNVRDYLYLMRNVLYPEAMPFRGARCMHINLALGTADAYLQEDTGFDISLAGTLHVRFYFQATGNLTMVDTDRFTIFQLQSAGPVSEVTVDVRNSSGEIQLICAETSAELDAVSRISPLVLDQWHCIELAVVLDSGVPGDGTIGFFVDGYQVGANITGLDQAAVIQARLGSIGIDAGTTAGHLLFDSVIADDTRIFPIRDRWAQNPMLTKSGHVCVGAGQLASVSLIAGAAADNVLRLHDTDEAEVGMNNLIIPPMTNSAASETAHYDIIGDLGYFERGVYVEMTGTNPQAMITLKEGKLSTALLRDHALRRLPYGV